MDVGLLSNRKIVQTEGLQRQGHRTGTTAENSVEGCVQGSYAVRDKRLSEELKGPQLGQGGNMLCRRLLRHRILRRTLAAGERIEAPHPGSPRAFQSSQLQGCPPWARL